MFIRDDMLTEVLKIQYPPMTFLTASIFYKPTVCIKFTWYVKEPQGWIEFFWSMDLLNSYENERI